MTKLWLVGGGGSSGWARVSHRLNLPPALCLLEKFWIFGQGREEGLEAEVGTSAEKGGGGIHTLQTAHICVYTLQVAAARTKTHGCRWIWGLKLDPEQTPTG